MPIYVSYDPSNDKKYPTTPEGLHQCVCVDVVDHGRVQKSYEGKAYEIHEVQLRWQTADADPETGRRYLLTRNFNLSLSPKSTLRKVLESWRGRKFTDDELRKLDVEVLIGQNCQIQVTHNPGSDGTVYARVDAVVRANPKEVAIRPSEDYVRVKDRPAKDNGSGAPSAKGSPVNSDDSVPF